jgi:NAD(P)-dependent dehydrogenase (short-subunit alcohol dehydrogenase family)
MSHGLVIVTGGARGIGAAISRKLAADGYAIAVNFASDEHAAETTVAAIRAAGAKAQAFRPHAAAHQEIPKLFEDSTAALGPLVGLVNNAGIGGGLVRVDERDPAELARLFEVNVIGTILCCKEGVRRLSTRHGGKGGSIVNISSIAARTGGLPGLAPYGASKGAVESFTRGLANEVGREGVRVNAVAPGMVATDMSKPFLVDPEAAKSIASMTPLGRIAHQKTSPRPSPG